MEFFWTSRRKTFLAVTIALSLLWLFELVTAFGPWVELHPRIDNGGVPTAGALEYYFVYGGGITYTLPWTSPVATVCTLLSLFLSPLHITLMVATVYHPYLRPRLIGIHQRWLVASPLRNILVIAGIKVVLLVAAVILFSDSFRHLRESAWGNTDCPPDITCSNPHLGFIGSVMIAIALVIWMMGLAVAYHQTNTSTVAPIREKRTLDAGSSLTSAPSLRDSTAHMNRQQLDSSRASAASFHGSYAHSTPAQRQVMR